MNIVFDLDCTIVDEVGKNVRDGMKEFFDKLREDGHKLILYSTSRKSRTESILNDNDLNKYFDKVLAREDYDPKEVQEKKDITIVDGDFLVDDDPLEITHAEAMKKRAFLLSSFRRNAKPREGELEELYKKINKKKGFFARLFGK